MSDRRQRTAGCRIRSSSNEIDDASSNKTDSRHGHGRRQRCCSRYETPLKRGRRASLKQQIVSYNNNSNKNTTTTTNNNNNTNTHNKAAAAAAQQQQQLQQQQHQSINSAKVCLISNSKQLQSILLITTLLFSSSVYSSSSSSSNRAAASSLSISDGGAIARVGASPLEDLSPQPSSWSPSSFERPTPANANQRQLHQQQQQQRQLDAHSLGKVSYHNNSELSFRDGYRDIESTRDEISNVSKHIERANGAGMGGVNLAPDGPTSPASATIPGDSSPRRAPTAEPLRTRSKRSIDEQQQQQPALATAASASDSASRQPLVDCRRLVMFWDFLSGSYPALGDHLLSVALGQFEQLAAREEQQQQQHESGTNSEFTQTVKLIGRLLDEAEQLARAQAAAGSGPNHHKQQQPTASSQHYLNKHQPLIINAQPNGGGYGWARPASAWLARVFANPAYAKIAQQHLQQQQQQQANSKQLGSAAHRHRFVSLARPAVNPDATTAAAAAVESGAGGVTYGRVAHSPHELVESGPSATKTLDKLHRLGGGQRSPEIQQQLANEIGRSIAIGGAAGKADIESNQIPLIGDDGSPQLTSAKPISPPADESAELRAKYVYGNVLLRPSQARLAAAGTDGGEPISQSIDKLRKYNRMRGLANEALPGQQTQSPSSQASREAAAAGSSFGRVLVGPYTTAGQQQKLGESIAIDQQQGLRTSQDLLKAPSSLNKLRDQLEPSQFGFPSAAAAASSTFAAIEQPSSQQADELSNQQHAGSMAAAAADADQSVDMAPDPQSDNEFVGLWHPAPLSQVQATRQVDGDSLSADSERNKNSNNGNGDSIGLSHGLGNEFLID